MAFDPLIAGTAARLAQSDLIEIDRQLSKRGQLDAHWVLLVKFAFISVANLADLESTIRTMYHTHPEVSAEYKVHKKKFEFAKYIRNIMVAHSDSSLIEKSLEWKPEIFSLLIDSSDESGYAVNLFILETAINTYVDNDENHLIFDGETDLMYPPNWDRFLAFLTDVVRGGLRFATKLVEATRSEMPPAPQGTESLLLFARAGKTVFRRIAKSTRS